MVSSSLEELIVDEDLAEELEEPTLERVARARFAPLDDATAAAVVRAFARRLTGAGYLFLGEKAELGNVEPVIDPSELAAIERLAGAPLPLDLRILLTTVGRSFAGPGFGFELEEIERVDPAGWLWGQLVWLHDKRAAGEIDAVQEHALAHVFHKLVDAHPVRAIVRISEWDGAWLVIGRGAAFVFSIEDGGFVPRLSSGERPRILTFAEWLGTLPVEEFVAWPRERPAGEAA